MAPKTCKPPSGTAKDIKVYAQFLKTEGDMMKLLNNMKKQKNYRHNVAKNCKKR